MGMFYVLTEHSVIAINQEFTQVRAVHRHPVSSTDRKFLCRDSQLPTFYWDTEWSFHTSPLQAVVEAWNWRHKYHWWL